MAINVAGKLSKLANRKCPSCKGPLPYTGLKWAVCEVCKNKACAICGKISVYGFVWLNESNCALCPRHYSAYHRAKENKEYLVWQTDREVKSWLEKRRLDTVYGPIARAEDEERERAINAMVSKMFPTAPEESIPGDSDSEKDELERYMEERKAKTIANLTDEEREFIKKLKDKE